MVRQSPKGSRRLAETLQALSVLVAYDLEEVTETVTLQAGRLFDGRWQLRRDEALHEVLRLRRAFADLLPTRAVTAIDGVLERARYLPSTAGEARAEASIRLLAERLERQAAVRPMSTGSPRTGDEPPLGDEALLRSWVGDTGTTASGTLPLALIGIRLKHSHDLPQRMARRTATMATMATMATIEVIRAVTALLRPVDRAVRLDGDDLLLILPSMSHDGAVALAGRVSCDIDAAHRTHPFVPETTSVIMVNRDRPLPLDQIRQGLNWSAAQAIPIATLGDSEHTAAGDASASSTVRGGEVR